LFATYIQMSEQKLSTNPFTVYGGFHSASRNMFLTSSVAVVIIGFSSQLGNFEYVIKLLGLLILLISITIGYKAAKDFNFYLDKLTKSNVVFADVPLNDWRQWKYTNYAYIFVLVVVSFAFAFTKIQRLSKN